MSGVGGIIDRDFDSVSSQARRMTVSRPDLEVFAASVTFYAGETPIATVQVDLQTPDGLPEAKASWTATLYTCGWTVAVRNYGEESPVAQWGVGPLESLRDLLAAADEYLAALAALAAAGGGERS